jgi:outer membrane protein assembly factor BamA
MKMLLIAVALALVAAVPRLAGADQIVRIVVDENTKSSDDTVILIADIEVGDDWTPAMVDEVRDRLVTSQLFKSVEVLAAPVLGGIEVLILARDKHSWVIAPTYYNQPGNKGAGFGFAEANLFGENKKLLLYAQYATADSFFLAGYQDPSIRQSRFKWQADLFARREEVTEYNIPSFTGDSAPVRESTLIYLNSGLKAGFSLFRAFSFDARLRGAWVDTRDARLVGEATSADVVRPEDVAAAAECDEATGLAPEPGMTGWDISTEYTIQLDRKANWYGIQTGTKLKLSYETALPSLGSDFDYWYLQGGFWWGERGYLLDRDNLSFSFGMDYGDDLPFQQEFTSGGVNLRGYQNREFRGDFKVRAGAEYSVPLFTVASLSFRALTFYDTAYTEFRDVEDSDGFRRYLPDPQKAFGPWKNGIGAGIRVYFRSVVIPLLGWDVGYGLEGGDFRTYFAIGLTEL